MNQEEIIAVLRIELEAARRERDEARAERDALTKQVEALRVELAEARSDARTDQKELVRLVAERDEARADVAAHSAPCSECRCQMRVCMDCAEAALAALRVERDALTKQLEEARAVEEVKLRGRSALLRVCEDERDALTKQVEALADVLRELVEHANSEHRCGACDAAETALAEFDAKRGGR